MSTLIRIIVAVVAVFGFAAVAHAHVSPAVLSGSCTGWPSPRVNLSWIYTGHYHLTNVEKGAYPPGPTYWGFVGAGSGAVPPITWGQPTPNYGDTSYTDWWVSPGTTYTWRVKTDASGPGAVSNVLAITVNACNCGGSCPPSDNATVSITAPGTVNTNQAFSVAIIANNTGTTTWNPSYSLNATSAANSAFWSAPSSVATAVTGPGGSSLHTVSFTAPAVPGVYSISPWRMYKPGPGFFGSQSGAPSVTVVAPNQPATGQVETTTCTGITGWARDPDTATARWVTMYRDGPMGVGTLVAGFWSNASHAAPYNGYGFSWPPLVDGISHTYFLYVQDLQDSVWYPLVGSPTAGLSCWPAPSVVLTSVTQGDYCSGGPQATANWQYSSGGGLQQAQWQLQVATNPGFAPVLFDSGVKPTLPMTPPPSTHSTGTGPGVLQFGTTYWFRVQGWNSLGTPSGWSAPLSTSTPASAYPAASFTYMPPTVFAAQPVQFTDTSTNGPTAWAWDFGDGQLGTGPNPTHTYAAQGSYLVKLDVTNAAGTCSTTQTLGANKPLPSFREVRPGQGTPTPTSPGQRLPPGGPTRP